MEQYVTIEGESSFFSTELRQPMIIKEGTKVSVREIFIQLGSVYLGTLQIYTETGLEAKISVYAQEGESFVSIIERINYDLLHHYISIEYNNYLNTLKIQNKLSYEAYYRYQLNDLIHFNNTYFDIKENSLELIDNSVNKKSFKKIVIGGMINKIFGNSELKTRENQLIKIENLKNRKLSLMPLVCYLKTNIIEHQLVNSTCDKLLRTLKIEKANQHIEFRNPQYLKVDKSYITHIQILLADYKGNKFNTKNIKITIILHFKNESICNITE